MAPNEAPPYQSSLFSGLCFFVFLCSLQLNGTYYDSSVIARAMLEDYSGAVMLSPGDFLPGFAYGKTYAAMLMNEENGRTVYFFFSLLPALPLVQL